MAPLFAVALEFLRRLAGTWQLPTPKLVACPLPNVAPYLLVLQHRLNEGMTPFVVVFVTDWRQNAHQGQHRLEALFYPLVGRWPQFVLLGVMPPLPPSVPHSVVVIPNYLCRRRVLHEVVAAFLVAMVVWRLPLFPRLKIAAGLPQLYHRQYLVALLQ